MNDFFSTSNWQDFIQEDYFWPTALFILLLIGGVISLVYFDRYKRWKATRQERAKMRQWLRPKL